MVGRTICHLHLSCPYCRRLGSSCEERDIIIENRNGLLKHINELRPSYLTLQYLLIFVHGEDGYRIGINHRELESYCSSNSNLRKSN